MHSKLPYVSRCCRLSPSSSLAPRGGTCSTQFEVLHHHQAAAVLAHQLFARLDGRPCTRRQPARSSLHPTAQLSSSDGCSVSVKLQGKMSQIASKVRLPSIQSAVAAPNRADGYTYRDMACLMRCCRGPLTTLHRLARRWLPTQHLRAIMLTVLSL
jgi:hypothetical protein